MVRTLVSMPLTCTWLLQDVNVALHIAQPDFKLYCFGVPMLCCRASACAWAACTGRPGWTPPMRCTTTAARRAPTLCSSRSHP